MDRSNYLAAIVSSLGALNGWTLMLAQVPLAAAQDGAATRKPLSRALRIGPYMPIGLVAFVFSMGTIYGSGATAGMWALILILMAAPVWVFLVEPGSQDDEEPQP